MTAKLITTIVANGWPTPWKKYSLQKKQVKCKKLCFESIDTRVFSCSYQCRRRKKLWPKLSFGFFLPLLGKVWPTLYSVGRQFTFRKVASIGSSKNGWEIFFAKVVWQSTLKISWRPSAVGPKSWKPEGGQIKEESRLNATLGRWSCWGVQGLWEKIRKTRFVPNI